MNGPAERYRMPGHVVSRSFERETILLNLRTGQYHGLNRTAGRMVALMQDGHALDDVAEKLADEVGMPLEEIAADVAELCAGLLERGLLEVDNSPRS